MKTRILAIFTVLVLLLTLTACGGSSVKKSPEEIADEILATQEFRDTLNPLDDDMIGYYYRMDDVEPEKAKVYLSGSFSTAEEIAVFKCKSADDVPAVEKAIERRLADQTLAFESYIPDEMVKIENPVIIIKDTTVVLVLADDTAAVTDKVNELLQ